jgi:archaellum component FlaC
MNEKEAFEAVRQYMEQQNRPYSIQNIMDNMHGRIPKKICETVLEKLTDQKHLICKEFGKAKIYLANQDKFPATDQKELDALDLQISSKRSQLDQATDQLK